MSTHKRRRSSGAQTIVSEKRARLSSSIQEACNSVHEQICDWPEVQLLSPIPETLDVMLRRLIKLWNDEISLFELYPAPVVQDYIHLHEHQLDVAHFDTELFQMAIDTHTEDLMQDIQSGLADLEAKISNALFTLLAIRPQLLEDYLIEVKEYAMVRLPELEGKPQKPKLEAFDGFKAGSRLNDETVNYIVDAWRLLTDPAFILVESWFAYAHFLHKETGEVLTELPELTMARAYRLLGPRTSLPRREDFQRFLVPIYKKKDHHWAVLVADFPAGIICVLDSFPLPGSEEFNRKLCEIVHKFLTHWWKVDGAAEGPDLRYVQAKVPHQMNGVDCGVHLLAWIEALLFADPIPTFDKMEETFTFNNLTYGAATFLPGYRMHFLAEMHRFLKYDFPQ